MRSGTKDYSHFHIMMNNIDNYVTDNSPVIDKYYAKYDEIFID